MHAEDQKQVLWGEAADWRFQQRDGLQACPQGRGIQREKEGSRGECPVQFNQHLAIGAEKFIYSEQARKESRRATILPAIALSPQQRLSAIRIPWADEDVQIPELPECQVPITRCRKDRPFVGKC
jgi:hypothetical protein